MIRLMFLLAVLLMCGAVCINAQRQCTGGQVFTEKSCDGDSLSAEERVLHDLLNEYRKSKGRPRVSQSDSLTWLANRHLLDVRFNLKKFTHSWSNCPYDEGNKATSDCMSGSARRLKTGFDGDTYETLFASSGGAADPRFAIESWKKSTLHNSILLNQGMFASMNWEEVGIAISGNYAAFWFGTSTAGGAGGIGASYEQALNGLTGLVKVRPAGQNRWSGVSKDGKVTIDLSGPKTDLSEAAMMVAASLEKNGRLSQTSLEALTTLAKNIFPEWSDAGEWIKSSVERILVNPADSRTKVIRKTHVSIAGGSNNKIQLNFAPENSKRVVRTF